MRVIQVLIQSRNQKVVDDLAALLKGVNVPRSLAVFYGAAHMPDMETRVSRQLNYRAREEFWLPAIRVNGDTADLTPGDVQLVRNLVKWQLDTLNSQKDKTETTK
jgi:hypothetical protein